MPDQVIKLALKSEASENQLRSKSGVAGIHSNSPLQEQIGRVAPAGNILQNIVGYPTCRRN